ncbi:ABC transporter permease [Terrisporobacter glycolicus]|uniref:Bacitracin export permease protein BceB n=1 Tax=Terrisporobacter glycolicus ATCC 14880 = DSM 1288 TaxID=1121315 RepID=A0ABZ2EWI3_9FIRM|nr:ABC transporter permease [Terrisporobacter glycolicus]
MLFKLSRRNVQRSIKDYSIYFFTLALGICIFYIFNSIESQTIMMDLSDTQKIFLDALNKIISMVSVFVSFVLGFLILYANNFLIKKRNKEFGIYMTLGISRSKIAFMLFYETIIVGILSLVVGIFIGVFLSQGLAGVTAKLFAIDMTEYKFIFSKDACLKTILYFGIMYFISMVFNFILVSRCKLINLINGDRNNEKLKGTNLILSVILFVISVVCLAVAYKLILENGLTDINDKFKLSIILGIVGTVLFFRALAGFLIKVIQSSKNQYLKNLNTFTLRQLNSKINTNYISMSVICLMLFISIGMYTASIGTKSAMENTAQFLAPYDMTLIHTYEKEENLKASKEKISETVKKIGFNIKDYTNEYLDYNIYNSPVKFKQLFKSTTDDFLSRQINSMRDFTVPIVKLSDYNKLMKMQNKETITLKDKEVFIFTDMSTIEPSVKEYVSKNKTMKIGQEDFEVNSQYGFNSIEDTLVSGNFATLVVKDENIRKYSLLKKCLSLNYIGDKKDTENKAVKNLEKGMAEGKKYKENDKVKISAMTRIIALEGNMASSSMYLYVGLYIGIIFLIASAAVLGLSQLSGAIESVGRYEILRKLGVSSNMINRSIFVQVLLYFAIPILLALVHSIFGIKVANDVVKIIGDYDTLGNNIISICIICAVYGVYFYGTYRGYKRIVNK